MNNKPIGVFDSGLGGLTVLKEIMKILPNEDIIYFGDTARIPYGSRSKETIIKYTFQAINFLKTKGVKAIVIACNTATARSLKEAQEKYDIPIIGVIEAGARTAVSSTKNKIVGIIGTEGTISSKAYNLEISKIDESIEIVNKACPLFVPIVEEGWANTEVAKLTAKIYLQELKEKNIDSLVLGCTHYPFVKRTISKVLGDDVAIIDGGHGTSLELKRKLKDKGELNDSKEKGKIEIYNSNNDSKVIDFCYNLINTK